MYLPELKDLKVGVERKTEGSDKLELALETPKREMTIHDLLRHTSGLTYGILGDSLVKARLPRGQCNGSDESLWRRW